jgi:hypothetical protein
MESLTVTPSESGEAAARLDAREVSDASMQICFLIRYGSEEQTVRGSEMADDRLDAEIIGAGRTSSSCTRC